MKTLPANGLQLYDVAVFNALVPSEGPKACPVIIPFTSSNTSFLLPSLLTQQQKFMSMIQAVFVDNSKNPEALYITTSVLNQTLKIKAGLMGYVPLLAPKNCEITFTSSGAQSVPIILLNVPVPAQLWDANEAAQGYVSVPASTNEALGLTGGAAGDYIEGILIIPATTSPDPVTITDGSGSPITVFAGGASSVGSLVPFYIPLGIQSTAGPWHIATGANESAIVTGQFT